MERERSWKGVIKFFTFANFVSFFIFHFLDSSPPTKEKMQEPSPTLPPPPLPSPLEFATEALEGPQEALQLAGEVFLEDRGASKAKKKKKTFARKNGGRRHENAFFDLLATPLKKNTKKLRPDLWRIPPRNFHLPRYRPRGGGSNSSNNNSDPDERAPSGPSEADSEGDPPRPSSSSRLRRRRGSKGPTFSFFRRKPLPNSAASLVSRFRAPAAAGPNSAPVRATSAAATAEGTREDRGGGS